MAVQATARLAWRICAAGEDKVAWERPRPFPRLEPLLVPPQALGAILQGRCGQAFPAGAAAELPDLGCALFKVGQSGAWEKFDDACRQSMLRQLYTMAMQKRSTPT